MKVLVPLDGSELAESAIPVAHKLVESCDGEVILLAVGELPETSTHRHEEHLALRGIVDRAAEGIEGVRVGVRTEMGGDAVAGILRTVEDEQIDQIVMSTHGRSGLSRLTHGSVADGVLRRSPVPVTLVRPGDQHESAQQALLRSDDCREIAAAAVALDGAGGRLSTEDLSRLKRCLKEIPRRDLLPVLEAYLNQLPVAERTDAILGFIKSGGGEEREAALVAARQLDESAIAHLATLTDEEAIEARWAAFSAIKAIGGEAAIEPLIKGLQDSEPGIRWVASDGLTAIGRAALLPLLRALAYREPTITFHRAARRVLQAVELRIHEPEVDQLLRSLSRSTTVVQSPGLADELLRVWEASTEA